MLLSFTIIVILLLAIRLYSIPIINPGFIWSAFQLIFLTGTLYITDFENEYHKENLWLYSFFIFWFWLFSLFFCGSKNKKPLIRLPKKSELKKLWFVFYLSAFMVVIYYYLVGSNFFLENIVHLVSRGSVMGDAANRRFEYYAGDKYYAPGFFNLFKNYLLPVSLFSLLALRGIGQIRFATFRVYLMVFFFLIAILGTGQRGAFVLSSVFLFIIYYIYTPKKFMYRKLRIYGILGFTLFIGSTYFLGRQNVSEINSISEIVLLASAGIERIAITNPRAGQYNYEYISRFENIQWGVDWLYSLEQFLPGRSQYYSISSKVFKFLYGSPRGTSPPTLVISSYYNFGIVGVILVPLFLNFVFYFIHRSINKKNATIVDVLIFSILYFSFGTWVVDGIAYPILNGLFLMPLLYSINRIKI